MKNKVIFVLALVAVCFATSCKKDDPEPEGGAGSGGSTDIIATSSAQMRTDIVSFTQSEGGDLAVSLADILATNSEPISATRMASSDDHKRAGKIYKAKAKAFRSIFVPGSSSRFRTASAEEDAFVFADNVGTYDFVRADSSWSYSSSPTDKIILNFPSDTTSSVNDAKLTITNYTEVMHITEPGTAFADTSYLPTAINATLYIGAVKYVEVNFTASYNAEGIPTSMSYTLYLKPFTNSLTYTDGGSSVSITASVAKDGESDIASSSGTVTFFDSNKDSVISVSGYTQYRSLKLSGSIDLSAIDADESNNGEASITTLNDNVDITIINNSNSQTVGTVEFFDNAGETDLQVRFTDNSTKLASDYFDPIITELEDFMTSVE